MLLAILTSSSAEAEGSWLSWSLEQAGHVSREAGSALYRGVKDLACIKLECCNQDWSESVRGYLLSRDKNRINFLKINQF